MALKPESSVLAGAAIAGMTVAIYNMHLPSVADTRQTPADDAHLEASRRQAAWWAAGLIGVVSMLTQDANIFIIAGATLVTMDLVHKHANQVVPETGKVSSQYDTTSMATAGNLYAVPEVGGAPAGFGGYDQGEYGSALG